ncbi:Bacterial Ig-like domain (group 2) [Thalassoglobus neptunius]|uniref:Bacterial Ig-like domain (Group 2) n=1 Tax=Thalassoglobus neptunius TaxID=1938619 RepID=A0A5C5WWR6_9PLAN|nr:DUF1549 domain-containing protein [Thalassoglobus neptunius]TWT55394.1 Bacterial Ig-like domain (group 2) [Thalassoglobus neptunius]
MSYRISKANLMFIAGMIILFGSTILMAEDNLAILPSQVFLDGPESSAQLLVQEKHGEILGRQISEDMEWSVADESIATVSRLGKLTPHADGKTVVTVKSTERTASIPVEVSGMMSDFRWSFRNDVLPILTKSGCNMGSCHGALAGKGGFRLSLHGYDAETDHFNITKQDRGRRVEFQDPGRSLLLAKPTGAMPHKGGLRIDTDSRDYRILSEWIASGAKAPNQDDPRIETISVIPSRVQLRPGEQQQLLGEAHYHNGTARDVTQWVKWTSTNEAVCTVDQTGRVEIVGPGEGAIVGWFSSKISVARITVPYDNKLPADTFAKLNARNFIDEHVNEQLARLNLPPSPRCDDMTFIRRVYLDCIGLPPTPEEVQKFLANTSETKRDDVIEHLLERPEFVDYWSYKWSDVLMLNGTLLRPQAVKSYYEWIHKHVANNTPWDQLVTEILTATGSTFQNGATNFYSLYQTPEDMTENACQAFLGLSIGCAKCHNHPLEKWTNDQYYAMANLFSRVKAKGWGGDSRNGDGLRTVFVSDRGELVQPRTGQPQLPTPLDGEPIPFDKTEDRRVPLAEWMTSPENPYFAKSITNRVWANFFGVGLVESVDDMRSSNPASNEELLAAAAQYLVDEQFNLKSLMRQILQSNTYQRSSLPVEGNEADTRFYSRYFPRRLIAEVIHDSIVQAVDVPTKFDFIGFPGADRQATDFYPLGTRAIQLYDSAVESYFLKTFGRNTRNIVCECERSNEPSMVQVLHMSNGSTINEKLQMAESQVQKLHAQLQNGMSIDSLIDNVYLRCLSRYPKPQERSAFVAIFQEAPPKEQRAVIEDLFWALLTSREFVFNH